MATTHRRDYIIRSLARLLALKLAVSLELDQLFQIELRAESRRLYVFFWWLDKR